MEKPTQPKRKFRGAVFVVLRNPGSYNPDKECQVVEIKGNRGAADTISGNTPNTYVKKFYYFKQ